MNPVQLPAPVCASLVGTNLEITVLPRAVRGLYRAFRSDVEMVVLRSKAGVSPDLPVESVHSNSCGKRVWKTQNNPPSAPAAFEALGCRCPVFSRARPRMCRREVWVAALNLIRLSLYDKSNLRQINERSFLFASPTCGPRRSKRSSNVPLWLQLQVANCNQPKLADIDALIVLMQLRLPFAAPRLGVERNTPAAFFLPRAVLLLACKAGAALLAVEPGGDT